MLKVKCMYTKQLAKKRKTWSDGYLKINLSTRRCVLIDEGDYREIGLAAGALEPVEMNKLGFKEEFTMELAGVMVQIESSGYSAGTPTAAPANQQYQPPLKLAKFVPPSTVIPKPKPAATNSSQDRQYPTSSSSYGVNPTKNYRVTNDELDDIWGGSGKDVSKQPSSSVDRSLSEVGSRVESTVYKPRRPASNEIDYESKYRPTPRPTFSGSSSDELQRIIDNQWMKDASEAPQKSEQSDDVWSVAINTSEPDGRVSTARSRSAAVDEPGLLPNGMTDLWGDSEASAAVADGVFNPDVVSGGDDEAGPSIHYDIGYATAALSDTGVVNESIWD